jgi:hypothetical protein
LLSASDSGVRAGTWRGLRQPFTCGVPSTNAHTYRSNDPCSACTRRKARALVTALAIFWRWRTMPASPISRSTSASVNRATFAGSNPANARR